MGTSNMRDRLSRVTDAPVQSGRRRGRDEQRGGRTGFLRSGGAVERGVVKRGVVKQRGHGQDGGFLNQLSRARSRDSMPQSRSWPSMPQNWSMPQSWQHQGAGIQEAARGAAGRAGSAMAGAAGMAARAGQSAGSALASRVSDVSGRMAEHAGDEGWQEGAPARRRGWSGQGDDAGHRLLEQRGGRAWEESHPGDAQHARSGLIGRISRHDDAGQSLSGPGARPMGMGEMGSGEMGGRGMSAGRMGQRGWGRRDGQWAPESMGRGREREQPAEQWAGQAGEKRGRRARRGQAMPGWEDQNQWQHWQRPDRQRWEELAASRGARGVSKRQVKRLRQAQEAADVSTQRAFEASEHAMRHGHSRRARKDEYKAVAQADRAQRMLDELLTGVERRMASSQRRRRRGLGMVLLAGAAAGITIAVRRMLSEQGEARQPGAADLDQTGAPTSRMTPASPFPSEGRMPEGMREDVATGRRTGSGSDPMSDNTSRRF